MPRKEERYETDMKVRLEAGEGVARNVSANGIYFVTDVALEEGQPVRLSLEFREFPSGPVAVECLARVVRVEQRGVGKGVAASIISMDLQRIAQPGTEGK